MKTNIKARVFIVGCPRSGTTLLQSMLASHSLIHSFPETHFFSYARPRNFYKRLLTWPALNVRRQLEVFLVETGREDLIKGSHISIFSRNYATKFIQLLDNLTLEANKSIWVEKTPRHLHCIGLIQDQVPQALFIHIVRNGADVVASLFDATNNQPEMWAKGQVNGFEGFSIDECVSRWNKDVFISEAHLEYSNHIVVSYEALVNDPEKEIGKVCKFLNVSFEAAMISNSKESSNLLLKTETWKKNNMEDIKNMRSKFKEIFNRDQQKYISQKLKKSELI